MLSRSNQSSFALRLPFDCHLARRGAPIVKIPAALPSLRRREAEFRFGITPSVNS
jgi:hypothetical protein